MFEQFNIFSEDKPGSNGKLPKNGLDQFYTKPEVAAGCLKKLGCLFDFDCVIEPSAGTGAFYSQIKHPRKIGLDIEPGSSGIIRQNWLDYEIAETYTNVAIVGNPPFGSFNNLSAAFIKHALKFSNVTRIGFILPNVYRKHTRQAILPPEWRIKTIWELPRDAFVYKGKTRHMPCCFFVFCKSKGIDLRTPTKLPDIPDFSFSDSGDYDLFVFGAAPKRIIKQAKPNNRGHFLKAHIDINQLIKNFKAVDWQGNSCANGGVYWLTKNELATQYYECHIAK